MRGVEETKDASRNRLDLWIGKQAKRSDQATLQRGLAPELAKGREVEARCGPGKTSCEPGLRPNRRRSSAPSRRASAISSGTRRDSCQRCSFVSPPVSSI